MQNSPWSLQSRIHRLNHFPQQDGRCYVKREDELSCGISGSKLRKYASLIPYWKKSGIEHLVVIGGAQSNNVLAAVQIAREYQWNITLFLLKPWEQKIQGNLALIKLFVPEKKIHWVERERWHEVETIARQFVTTQKQTCYLLSEGASVAPALAGAMTLGDDIIRNEQELSEPFKHIFIEAGTGFSALSLIKSMQQHQHSSTIHVLLLADKVDKFKHELKRYLPSGASNYCCHAPKTAKAFGSVNASIRNEIKRMAEEEGILVDPIYSAKLFYFTRNYLCQNQCSGNSLIIHSGGVLSLPSWINGAGQSLF